MFFGTEYLGGGMFNGISFKSVSIGTGAVKIETKKRGLKRRG